jgi:ABC-type bacteriocin/lantibiotic exporters, contain an N-terminal double-glycine peptidase domain
MRELMKEGWFGIRPYKKGFFIYLFLASIATLVSLLRPYITGELIDFLAVGTNEHNLYRYCLLFIAINIALLGLGYIGALLQRSFSAQASYTVKRKMIEHIHKTTVTTIGSYDSAYLNQRISRDSDELVQFTSSVIHGFLTQSILVILPGIILLRLSLRIAVLLFASLMVYVGLYAATRKSLSAVVQRLNDAQNLFFAAQSEHIESAKSIRTHGAERFFLDRLAMSFAHMLKDTLRHQRTIGAINALDNSIAMFIQVALFLFGGLAVIQGELSVGLFTIFSSYFALMMGAARYFFGVGASYRSAVTAYNRIKEILGWTAENDGLTRVNEPITKITTNNLTFSYGDRGGQLFMGSIELERGKIYAVVGENGSGKSTFLSLLIGLYSPSAGNIYFNNYQVPEIDMRSFREEKIGFVEQEGKLFNVPLIENIFLRNDLCEETNETQLVELSTMLGLEAFFDDNAKDGFTSTAGINNSISGGERQKIAILRALVKSPDILVFDEPTSALDTHSAQIMLDYLQQIKSEKIVIVVSHDANVISECDEKIYFPKA